MTDVYSKLMKIGKRRGIIWPSFEIYGSASGFYDYGPNGTQILRNIKDKWREYYNDQEGFGEITTTTIMGEKVFQGSGHLEGFEDAMTQCKQCNKSYRADHLVEQYTEIQADSLPNKEIHNLIKQNNVQCPECNGQLGEVYDFNLMFNTDIGPGSSRPGYLRPETAQGMFVNYPYLYKHNREKLPFGTIQIGRAYRNEISPRQGIIRLREFIQMEAEIFVHPENKKHPKFKQYQDIEIKLHPTKQQQNEEKPIKTTLKKAVDKGWIGNEMIAYYIGLSTKYFKEIGINPNKLRYRQHLPDEMAHYASECWDAEAHSERFGWIEIAGISDRTNYDLKKHSQTSGKQLTAFERYDKPKQKTKTTIEPQMDILGPELKEKAKPVAETIQQMNPNKIKQMLEKGPIELNVNGEKIEINKKHIEINKTKQTIRGEKIHPHVIEPSYGLDRIFYITLEHAYTQDTQNGEKRNLLQLKKQIAPIQTAIFPLLNKKQLTNKAQKIHKKLKKQYKTTIDTSGSIGRRYRRQDEIGTPYCITIDHQTLKDNTITIRERDTTKQIRIKTNQLPNTLKKLFNGTKLQEITKQPKN
ncbi:Glycyl-tRNA synthetase class II [Methanonatronarchaeum thermophilum]|uniref:glycine--tRNA ligase n=1 Tax=Methanonatronarchaeum thermophilum TaxID=1927129 RepID=A0A1Y3GA57_9EURY|nr:glycine--tRNA ligase [Methanonatronarchaeum thermophilum]OUJ18130.1 Glycyl-tRNA synthetase class II [Methanonatronarchaeum thermophilum]